MKNTIDLLIKQYKEACDHEAKVEDDLKIIKQDKQKLKDEIVKLLKEAGIESELVIYAQQPTTISVTSGMTTPVWYNLNNNQQANGGHWFNGIWYNY